MFDVVGEGLQRRICEFDKDYVFCVGIGIVGEA